MSRGVVRSRGVVVTSRCVVTSRGVVGSLLLSLFLVLVKSHLIRKHVPVQLKALYLRINCLWSYSHAGYQPTVIVYILDNIYNN